MNRAIPASTRTRRRTFWLSNTVSPEKFEIVKAKQRELGTKGGRGRLPEQRVPGEELKPRVPGEENLRRRAQWAHESPIKKEHDSI